MAFLQVLKGLNPGQVIPLEQMRSTLGRHPDCDIVLNVGAVSREHALIERLDDGFYVRDLESRNGTFVNGEAIQERRRLEDNDRLKICDLLFTFHVDHPAKPKPRTTLPSPQQPVGLLASGALASTPTAAGAAAVSESGLLGGLDLSDEAQPPERQSSTVLASMALSSKVDPNLTAGARAEMKLRALYEITDNLRKALDLDDILPKILDTLFALFVQADRGFVVLRERADGPLLIKTVKHRRPAMADQTRPSRTIINKVMETREALLTADASSDSRFDPSQSIADFHIRSAMCAPLLDAEGNALGIIQLDTNDHRHRFAEDDLSVLATVALQAAIVVENAQLHQQAMRQQQIAHELQLARRVQQGFLPHSRPELPGYEFFDFYEPAKQVGGDYYDYIPLSGNRLAIVVADVSGKGIPAALLMAKLSAEMRYYLVCSDSPAEAVRQINDSFFQGEWEDRFVTMAVTVVSPDDHTLRLVNAGHMDPLLRHVDGRVEGIGAEVAGVPIGVAEGYPYEETVVQLGPGESLTMFSDGISEAMNLAGELYGIERLTEQVAKLTSGSIVQCGKQLLDDVKRFAGQQAQSDDMCLVMFGRTG
ncbi:MAG: SpoIIE family protein phosphatase [Pirellulales bacterium]|nr:SpoIIE family protein phosphatase [Pirellulales bacterium]